MNKALLVLGLGAGAYFLTKKQPVKKEVKKDLPSLDDEELPPPPKDEELEGLDDYDFDTLPQVDPNDPNKPVQDDLVIEEGNIIPQINMTKFYDPFYVTGKEQPDNPDTTKLWLSDTCLSWGIGRDFVPALPALYLFENPSDPEQMITPMEYWDMVGGDISPAPYYYNHFQNDIPARAFVANLIDYYSKCNISVPRRSSFNNYGDYKIVMTNFAKTPMGQLNEKMYKEIRQMMYDHWAQQYPDKAFLEDLKGWALRAVLKNPGASIVKQTDIAYAGMFEDDPNAPKKIDPKNPAHKPYLDAWIRIEIYVKEYRGYIKQYGVP